MIRVTDRIILDENDIRIDFTHSSGPGGQNVNKVATAVQLRFRVADNPSLPPPVRERLMRLAGNKMTSAGELLILARRHRTQERNRRDAVERLIDLVREAAEPPKPRRATKPSLRSVAKRVDRKKRRGKIKKERRWSGNDDN